MKHTKEIICPSCEEKLKTANAYLCTWFLESVKPMYPDCHVSWAFRGMEDQEKAFKDGKSKLHFPLSLHNYTDEKGYPRARAIDLFQIDEIGRAVFSRKFYSLINDDIKKAELDIKWGGEFKSLGDFDHFEMIAKG